MKARFGVVTRDACRSWEMKALHQAARGRGAELVVVDPSAATIDLISGCLLGAGGERISLDAALGRVDAGCLSAGVRVLQALEGALPLLNGPTAFGMGRDKRLMTRALARAGVPHPPTWLVAPGDVPALARALPYPLVVKPALGAGGRGIVRIAGPRALMDLAKGKREPMYIQSFYKGITKELRLLVLDGEILGAMRRTPKQGEWRANLAMGGRAQKAAVDPAGRRVALLAARAVKADFAGVDLAYGPDGPLVLEVNVCPGFRGFTLTTGIDVASRLVDALYRRSQKEGVHRESSGAHSIKEAVQGA